jgi:hypothetical protein
MKQLVSIAVCGLAAATFALPAAADDSKARAGANASVEGGVALGGTGVQNAPRSGDAQVRRDNNEDKAKPKTRAQRKKERDASSGTSGKTY